jgi:ribosomal protein L5
LAGELQTKLSLKNPNAVPKLEKIVINIGIGKMPTKMVKRAPVAINGA